MSVFLTALLALSSPATPQNASAQTLLYSPSREIADQKITLRGWGSGTGSETDETYYEGAHSIRVSTRNYFQGAQLIYGAPIDLSEEFADKNNLLKIVVKTSDSDPTTGGGMGSRGSGGDGGRPGTGGPGMGAPGMGGPGGGGRGGPGMGGPGMGGPGMGGRGGQGGPGMGAPGMGAPGQGGGIGPGAGSSTTPTLSTVRLIVTTTDGKKSEAYMPVSTGNGGERGWKTVAIPLQAINGFDRTNKIVKDVTFSGDVTTTFYVGDVRVVEDSTPVRGEVYATYNGVTSGTRRSYNLALADRLTFTGNGQGGASVLEYVWDFNATDGLQQDAIGQTVTHQFRNPGKFTVTLTIRDKYGLKPATTSTVNVVVNP